MLGNPSWCVWTAQKQAANTFANCWRQIETCLPTVFMPFTHTNLSLPTLVCCVKAALEPIKERCKLLTSGFRCTSLKWKKSSCAKLVLLLGTRNFLVSNLHLSFIGNAFIAVVIAIWATSNFNLRNSFRAKFAVAYSAITTAMNASPFH